MICEFCSELARDGSGRMFYEDEHFAAFPGLGAFVEGYTLLVPRRHVYSCAELDAVEMKALASLVDRLVDEMEQEFDASIVIAEHGSNDCAVGAGCVDHAHLHLIPVSDVGAVAAEFFAADPSGQPVDRFEDLREAVGDPYIYLRTGDDTQWLWKAELFSRQFVRQVCCRLLGIPNQYDWREYPFIAEMFSTFTRLANRLDS